MKKIDKITRAPQSDLIRKINEIIDVVNALAAKSNIYSDGIGPSPYDLSAFKPKRK